MDKKRHPNYYEAERLCELGKGMDAYYLGLAHGERGHTDDSNPYEEDSVDWYKFGLGWIQGNYTIRCH